MENGKKLYRARAKATTSDGRQICRKRTGIASYNQARAVEIDLLIEVKQKASKQFDWTFDRWHRECIKQMRYTLKDGTIRGYEGALNQWLDKEWKAKLLGEISKSDIYDLLFKTVGDRTSMNAKRAIKKKLHRIFELAIEEGLITRNPCAGIEIKLPDSKQLVLNSNEANKLLKISKETNHRFFPVWYFALQTGMRSGEMYALQWKDIDFESNLIHVTKQWTSKDGLHTTKSGRHRVVPINKKFAKYLTEIKMSAHYKEEVWDGQHKCSVILSDLVLPRLTEWRGGLQAQVLEDFCSGIGITAVKFHDLRATFITNLLSQGVPLVKVMAIVGHSKMSTTDRYLRLGGVELQGVTEKLSFGVEEEQCARVLRLVER